MAVPCRDVPMAAMSSNVRMAVLAFLHSSSNVRKAGRCTTRQVGVRTSESGDPDAASPRTRCLPTLCIACVAASMCLLRGHHCPWCSRRSCTAAAMCERQGGAQQGKLVRALRNWGTLWLLPLAHYTPNPSANLCARPSSRYWGRFHGMCAADAARSRRSGMKIQH